MSIDSQTRLDETHLVTVPGASTFTCSEGDTLLRAALRAGIPAGYECNSGGCGSCKFTVDTGAVTVMQENAAGLSARDRRKNKQLACQSVPASDLSVRMLLGDSWPAGHVRPRRFTAKVVERRALTHDLVEISLQAHGRADFLPGQFAMVSLDGQFGGSQHNERAYSMSNLPNSEGIWQFQVKRVPDGAVSGRVTDLSPGAIVDLDGPFGHAHLKDTGRNIVCIAGGSGLAPMISIARGLAARGDAAERRLDFFYGARSTRDRCIAELITEVTETVRQTRLIEALSAADGEDWDGVRGFVHEVLDSHGPDDLAERDIYVAGPPMMTDAVVRKLVLERQIPVEQIHYDRFF